jgi:hypothetical protein
MLLWRPVFRGLFREGSESGTMYSGRWRESPLPHHSPSMGGGKSGLCHTRRDVCAGPLETRWPLGGVGSGFRGGMRSWHARHSSDLRRRTEVAHIPLIASANFGGVTTTVPYGCRDEWRGRHGTRTLNHLPAPNIQSGGTHAASPFVLS